MADLVQNFFDGIEAEAKKTLGTLLQGDIQPIQLGSQGDFPWFWKDANGNFNQNTFDYISRRAVGGANGPVSLPDSFVNAWVEVLSDLTWQMSSADTQAKNAAQLKAQVQATAVVAAYTQSGYQITSADLDEAKTALGFAVNKLDFVILYKIGYQWSGAQANKTAPMTYQQILGARNYSQSFPNMPPSGASVVDATSTYLSILGSTLSLQDKATTAQWLRRQLTAAVQGPSAQNGGMQTVDDNGATLWQAAYSLDKSVAEISNSLGNAGSALNISMTASRVDANEMSVNVSGKAAATIPLDFLAIDLGGSASYSLFQANGSGSSASIDMTFPGLTVVSVQAAEFQQTNLTGWFLGKIVADAASNTGKDVTGWAFSPKPSYDFGRNGSFGMLAALVIAGYPTVKITYSAGNYSQFKQTFQQSASVGLRLFGIPLGGVKESSYHSQLSDQAQDGSFSITLSPPPQNSTVNPLDQKAFVIGGVIANPGDAKTAALRNFAAAMGNVAPMTMVKLGGVSFRNQTGGAIEVYSMLNRHTTVTDIAPVATSGAISGTLLNIDVVRQGTRYSYDLANFMPSGLLVEDESPYGLKQVLGTDGRTLELVITDNTGETVGSFRPAGILV